MAEFEQRFGERIRAMRLALGLTQKQLGAAVGVSKQAIQNVEVGRRETTITRAIAIARVLNTTVEYLAGVTDNPSRPETST